MRFTYHLLALASVALAANGVGASSLTEDGSSARAGDGEGVVSLVIKPASGSEIAATELATLPGVQVERDLTGLGLVRVVATAEAAAALRASGFVAQAVTSHPMEVLLDESIAIVEADIAGAEGAVGTCSVIAVIDSGVDTSHPAFNGRVVGEACFLESAGGICSTGARRAPARGRPPRAPSCPVTAPMARMWPDAFRRRRRSEGSRPPLDCWRSGLCTSRSPNRPRSLNSSPPRSAALTFLMRSTTC